MNSHTPIVKPLEWNGFGQAHSVLGTYDVCCIAQGGIFGLRLPGEENNTFSSAEGSEENCMAAAQAHYEKCILGALTPEALEAVNSHASLTERVRVLEEEKAKPIAACRAIDDLLYRLEPFLAAASIVLDRPHEYQPSVARIGGLANARDLRVEDFQRLVKAVDATRASLNTEGE